MKNNKLTKNGILLLFGISILLWNCQKDETIEHTHESIENTDSKLSRVSINDLIKNDETFSKLSENYLTDKISKKGFSAKNSSNGLIITSDTINVVEKENYKSYTIRIKREGYEYDTENLIIEQKDSIESAYILSYDFDNEWIANRLKGIHNPPKGKIYYSEFDTSIFSSKSTSAKSSSNCNYITITIIAPCGCGHYYVPPCKGNYNSCTGNVWPTSYTTSQLVCDSGGGSDNDFGGPLDSDDGNEGGSGGGGGGGPSPSDSNDNSQTQSNLEDMAEFVEFKINKLITQLELNDSQVQWITNDNNVQKALEIYDYVARDNVWAMEAKEFAKLAVEAEKNSGEVDYESEIIYDNSFQNTKTECIHNKMKTNNNNIYSKMLNHFSSTTQKNLTFSINNTIGTDWGITNGNMQVQNDYKIIINQNLIENNGSNLMKYVTLCHELIHAYMFDALEDVGVITFDITGLPVLNVNCPTNNINLNGQNIKDRFVSLICAMNTAGTLTQDWTHDLFNSNVFNIQDYRQQLENLIINDYDWNSESSTFTNNANSTFGSNWKQEVAKAISWIGLENTNEYSTYLNSYSTQPLKFLFISDIRNKISNTNNNCP